jgi:alpha-maltose-1-phosphate synthase
VVIISHPTGNANVRNAALAFGEAGLLVRFVTSVAFSERAAASRAFPPFLRRLCVRRIYPPAVLAKTSAFPLREIGRNVLLQVRMKSWVNDVKAPFSIDSVFRSIDRHTAALLAQHPETKAVYCYEDAAVQTFRAAKVAGLTTVYELPTPYWRCKEEIGREEAKRQPEWVGTLRFDRESADKLARKDEELRLADLVIVPSEFVAESLKLAPAVPGRIIVLPYGAPVTTGAGSRPIRDSAERHNDDPLRIIYVGNLGQAKGIAYLIDAIDALGARVELTLIGRPLFDSPSMLSGFLQKHRHFPSLPHAEVLRMIGEHDVLVLPTLYEGLALVLLEAMGQGLTVVTTPNSGATGIVRDGKEGFIVPIRSAEAIVDRLAWLADHREETRAMGEAARAKAAAYTWADYRARIVEVLQGHLASRS